MVSQLRKAPEWPRQTFKCAFYRAQVDKAALDAQVRERREREAAEAATARAAAQAAADHESTAQQRAVAAMEARRAQYKGTDAFRHEQQVRMSADGSV